MLATAILIASLLAQPLPPAGSCQAPSCTGTAGSGLSAFKMTQGARFCLNNTACTAYIAYDGTYIDLSKPLLITQTAANTGFNFTTTQVKLSLGNTSNFVNESPTASPSSLPAWQFSGMAQLQILATGTNESGTLSLKQSSTGAFNTIDWNDSAGVTKMQMGYGNSGTASPYTSQPFVWTAASTDLVFLNGGSSVELGRIKSTGTIKSAAGSGVNAFEAATVGSKLQLGNATLTNDSSSRLVSLGDIVAGINLVSTNGALSTNTGSTSIRLRGNAANSAGVCAVHAENQVTLNTNNAQIFCASPDNNVTFPFAVDYSGKLLLSTTDSSGSPGAVTINKPSGKAAVAASATSVVVTDSTVLTTSSIMLTPLDLDTTCINWKAVPASGSFTVTVNVACTAAWKFSFLVLN